MKKRKKTGKKIDSHIKVSEMLIKVGSEFIQFGSTIEQRENNLRIVASAWNMACHEELLREKYIQDAIMVYTRINNSDTEHKEAYEHALRQLISRKLALFPSEMVQIINVRMYEEDGKEQIWATSVKMT